MIWNIGESYLLTAYIICSILVFLVPSLMESVRGRMIRIDKSIGVLDWFEVRGMAIIFHILSLISLLTLAYIGWKIPDYIRARAPMQDLLIHNILSIDILERTAQVMGAVAGVSTSYRLTRYFVPVFGIFILILIAILVHTYIMTGEFTILLQ